MSLEGARQRLYSGDLKGAVTLLWQSHSAAVDDRDYVTIESVIVIATEIGQRDPRARSDANRLIKVAERSLASIGAPSPEGREIAVSHALTARREEITRTASSRDLLPSSTFEYAVVSLDPDETAQYLSEAGSLGWDLVSVTSDRDGRERLYLKRVVSSPTGQAGSETSRGFGVFYAESEVVSDDGGE